MRASKRSRKEDKDVFAHGLIEVFFNRFQLVADELFSSGRLLFDPFAYVGNGFFQVDKFLHLHAHAAVEINKRPLVLSMSSISGYMAQ